ncbi:hypothetical protein GCM10009642_32260 [Nocardiopsis metallicus]
MPRPQSAGGSPDLPENGHSAFCCDYVPVGLNEAARKELEGMMAVETYQWRSDFAREYVGIGEEKHAKKAWTKAGSPKPPGTWSRSSRRVGSPSRKRHASASKPAPNWTLPRSGFPRGTRRTC